MSRCLSVLQNSRSRADRADEASRAGEGHSAAIRYFLGALLALIALNAFAGGYYGLKGADGVPTEWLQGSPFRDYFVPSLILLIAVGGSSAIASVAVFEGLRVARLAAFAAGLIVLCWLAVQVAIIGNVSWMQPTTAIAASLVLVLGSLLRPSRQMTRTIE
jgi:hypothetical protein